MGIGFIQDKLEIKFLILYIAARVTEPLTPEDMQDLTMCDDGIDYFDYAECLNDLVKTEHLHQLKGVIVDCVRVCNIGGAHCLFQLGADRAARGLEVVPNAGAHLVKNGFCVMQL